MNNEELFERNTNLAYKIASSYKSKYPSEYEDIKQIALIGLWKSVQQYDENYKFSTFAWVVINRDIIKYLSRQKKHLETSHLEAQTIGDLTKMGCLKSDEYELEDAIIKHDNNQTFKELIDLAKLTPKETETFNEMRKGLKTIQIAKKYNVSKQCISGRIKNILKKIEKVTLNGGKEIFM